MIARVGAALGVTAAICAAAVLGGAPASAQDDAPCWGDPAAAGAAAEPGPRLRFGINPAGTAGAIGPAVEPVPDSPGKTRQALEKLEPPAGSPFYIRLNRFFWS